MEDHHAKLCTLEAEHSSAAVHADMCKIISNVGTAFVMAGINTNMLVMQAFSGTHLDQ